MLCLAQSSPSLTCPTGTRLEETTSGDETWLGCVDDTGASGPVRRTQRDGGLIEAGRFERQKKQGPWLQRGGDGGLVTLEYVDGREGPVRPCPAGSREKTRCVAHCCDVSARWCALRDGGMTGPWDEWSVDGRRLRSNLGDPLWPAPFRHLGAVRDEPFELSSDDPR